MTKHSYSSTSIGGQVIYNDGRDEITNIISNAVKKRGGSRPSTSHSPAGGGARQHGPQQKTLADLPTSVPKLPVSLAPREKTLEYVMRALTTDQSSDGRGRGDVLAAYGMVRFFLPPFTPPPSPR